MATKKPSIAPIGIGNRKATKSVEDFINGAAASTNQEEPAAAASASPTDGLKDKKKQIPLMILPTLLLELDAELTKGGVGHSRAAWICQAIREKLDRDNG